jgi:hypothetical protein
MSAMVVGAAAPSAALAHHSFAMFDYTRIVMLDAVVQSFAWSNPHASLSLLAQAPGGAAPEPWSVELSSPLNLKRAGWSPDSLKPGDKVRIQIHPSRETPREGAFEQARNLTSGKLLKGGGLTEAGCCD